MGKNDENQENKKRESVVILKALIHCEGCSNQISKCLRGLDGVKQVEIDRENERVIVRGEVVNDPVKVLERLQKKYSKNVELISPKPKPENCNQKRAPETKEQKPKVRIMVLKMYLHCDGCVSLVKRKIERMEGIDYVEVDKEKSEVVVKGTVEATKLIEDVKRKLGKHAELMNGIINKREPKNEEKNNEKRNQLVNVIMYSYPPQYCTNYLYPCQTFSDENVFACSIM